MKETLQWWRYITLGLLLLSSGHMYVVDETFMYNTTIGMWDLMWGTYRGNVVDIFNRYGPVQSLLALPFLGVGRILSRLVEVELREFVVQWVVTWQSSFVVATTAVLMRWIVIRLKYSVTVANLLMLVYAFGSMATVYSRTFFSDTTVAMWLLIGAIPLIVYGPYTPRMKVLMGICGISLVLAVATKIVVAPAVMIWVAAIFFMIWRDRDWTKLRYWVIGMIIGAICYVSFNVLLYNNIFGRVAVRGYAGGSLTSDVTVIWQGLYGLYFSWKKSIFIYTPFALIWPFGILWRRLPARLFWPTVFVIIMVSLIHAAFVEGAQLSWPGGGSWGPRYLGIVLPLILLSTAPVWDYLFTYRLTFCRYLIGTLSALTLFVIAGALIINFNTHILSRIASPHYNAPWYNAVIGHWEILRNQVYTDWQASQIPHVKLEGWSYSEGDLDKEQSFPRWLGERAVIHVRTTADTQPWVAFRVWQCIGATAPERWVEITYQSHLLGRVAGCPARVVRLMLAGGQSSIVLATTGGPAVPVDAYQYGWISTYGALVDRFEAYDRAQVIPVRTRPFAEEHLPQRDFRLWLSDIRRGTYDFWWYYLWLFSPAHASVGWLVIAVLALWSMLLDWSRIIQWLRDQRWLHQT